MSRQKEEIRPQAIQIGGAYHAWLDRRARQLSEESRAQGGRRVTIRAVLEQAIAIAYPEAQAEIGQQPAGQPVDQQLDLSNYDAMFDGLVELLFTSDAAEQNAQIEALRESVSGAYGQPIPLKVLAYHLRAAVESGKMIGSIRELVADYEQCG